MKALSDDHPTADDLIPSVRRSVEAARAVPGRQGDRHHPVGGAAPDRGDAALRPLGQLRLDGHARRPTRRRRPRRSTTSRRSRRTGTPKHKEEHLRLFNPPVVAMINVHEAYPGPLPPVPLRPAVPDQDPQADLLRHQRRGLGALHRADDGRRGLRRRRPEDPPGPAPGGAAPRLPLRRRHQAAHRRA